MFDYSWKKVFSARLMDIAAFGHPFWYLQLSVWTVCPVFRFSALWPTITKTIFRATKKQTPFYYIPRCSRAAWCLSIISVDICLFHYCWPMGMEWFRPCSHCFVGWYPRSNPQSTRTTTWSRFRNSEETNWSQRSHKKNILSQFSPSSNFSFYTSKANAPRCVPGWSAHKEPKFG